jgi:multisubunit Na+/H+ antiporter MnhG subunit
MSGLYIISAMLGGIDAVYGIAAYAGLAGMIAVAKRMYTRSHANDRIPLYEYLILILCSVIYIEIWTRYPLNIVLIGMILVGCIFSHVVRRRT